TTARIRARASSASTGSGRASMDSRPAPERPSAPTELVGVRAPHLAGQVPNEALSALYLARGEPCSILRADHDRCVVFRAGVRGAAGEQNAHDRGYSLHSVITSWLGSGVRRLRTGAIGPGASSFLPLEY